MLRRNFLSSLGILPFFNFKKKDKENSNNLPVVKFDENGCITNHKELLNGKDQVLVFVRAEDKVLGENENSYYHGEMMLEKTWCLDLKLTKNTKPTKINRQWNLL